METFSVQSIRAAGIRPIEASRPDLSAILQDGKVLAGEILQTFGGGSVLIGIGSHRIAAESQVELHAGDRFAFLVEGSGADVILKILGSGGDAEPELIRALRSVLGEDLPIGRLLGDLAAQVRLASESGAAPSLLEDLAEHLFEPGSSGAELRELLQRSGLRYETLLARAAGGADAPESASLPVLSPRALAASWVEAWVSGASDVVPQAVRDLVERIVRALSESLRVAEAEGPEAALRHARVHLQRTAAALPDERLRQLALTGLADQQGGAPTRQSALLALLLGRAPSADARSLATWIAGAAVAGLELDLKAQLLRARSILPDGLARDAAARALAGLEAEQLLNLARSRFGEALHWTFPLPDGGRDGSWQTVHLFHRGAAEDGEGTGAERRLDHRITLGVELTGLGPVRADLLLGAEALSLRLTVARPEIVERLQRDAATLCELLSSSGRPAHVAVVLGTPHEASVEALSRDIRYLREHQVLDLSG